MRRSEGLASSSTRSSCTKRAPGVSESTRTCSRRLVTEDCSAYRCDGWTCCHGGADLGQQAEREQQCQSTQESEDLELDRPHHFPPVLLREDGHSSRRAH